MKHTPGLTSEEDIERIRYVVAIAGRLSDRKVFDRIAKKARLSPDLLEAAEDVDGMLEGMSFPPSILGKLKRAIRKARKVKR